MTRASGDQTDDAALLAAIAAGDRGAFEAFYHRHAPWLLLRLRHRCADEALVDDVVQETFLSVWRGARGYRKAAAGAAPGWLWRIASRRLVDALRGHSTRERLWRRLRGRRPVDEPSAEQQVLLGVEHGDLAGAIDGLAPELRAVVQATVLDGLTTRQAAALLGIPVGTVKTRAMRARQQLREALADPYQ